jgi:uncharacterized membrane protein
MMKPITRQIALAILLSLGFALPASAHCVVGNRFFPATLTVDDPCVADELSIPTIAGFKNGDDPSAQELDISGEYSKTITRNFGVSFEEEWIHLVLATRRMAAAACLAGLAVLLEAGHGHAFAMAPGSSVLLVSQALHLLAAGAWLGGLLSLFPVVREAPLDVAAFAARRFSTLGLVAVLTLAATALGQGWVLGGGLAGLRGTAYGGVLLTKTVLFALMIALAVRNRFRLAPALEGPQGPGSRRLLLRAIFVETALGLGVVLAAGVLSGLEPGMHRV